MKNIINTDKAPTAIGPYSQAVEVPAGTAIYCSGQVALDPETMALVGETAAEQTRQAMANLAAVLNQAGVDMQQIVKTTIYLADLNDFAAVNEVYAGFFTGEPPARVTVQVSRLPLDARVEIDAIAVR